MKNRILPIFIPHLGCKYNCIYCNQKNISGIKNMKNTLSDIKMQIDKKSSVSSDFNEIAFYGGSFTSIEPRNQVQLLDYIKSKFSSVKIRISTYPENITEKNIKFLKKYNVKTIELGIQNLNRTVLKKIGRSANLKQIYSSINLIKKNNIKLGLQIITGLPGSSKKKDLETLKKIIKINPDYLRIYPLAVVKDTELYKLYKIKKFMPLKLSEIIDLVSDMLILLENTKIKVIRIGLHSEVDLVHNNIINTDSYHPSMGEMIKSEFIKKKITSFLKKKSCKIYKINIKFNPDIYSLIVGNKKSNINFYINNNIEFIKDKRMNKKHIVLKFSNKTKYDILLK